MTRIEKSLTLTDETAAIEPVNDGDRVCLLELADRLAEPQLDYTARLFLVEQMHCVLNCELPEQAVIAL
jgi:hypothetical protein